MKKAVLALMAVMILIGAAAKADEPKQSKYEVSTVNGETYVLIPTLLAEQMDRISKSNLTDDDKLATVRALFFSEGTLNQYKETYCKVVGETYKNVNANADKMALKCQDKLQDSSLIESLDNGALSIQELRTTISGYLKLMIIGF